MSSVLKYLTRRIQPFKQCVEINHSPDAKNSQNSMLKKIDSEKKVTKRSGKKRRKFSLKLKRSIKSNLDQCNQNARTPLKEANSITNSNNETEKMEISSQIFNDPYKLNQNSMFNSPVYSENTEFLNQNEFSPLSPEADFAYSSEINIDHKRASCSTYDIDCFPFQSVSNSTPENCSNNSMLTYNTKYDASNFTNEDAMMSTSASLIQQSSDSINDRQESTPNGKSFKRNITKSKTTYFPQISETNTDVKKQNGLGRKCRRSNTTYTTRSNQIIDYFTNLELSKPLLKTNLRHNNVLTSRKLQTSQEFKEDNSEDIYTMFNDIEKLQDAFFNDSSVNKNSSNNDNSQKNNQSITAPSSFDSYSSQQKTESSGFLDYSSGFKSKYDYENNSIENSIEKARRTISSPGIKSQSSILMENFSKISPVRGADLANEEVEKITETTNSSVSTETLVDNNKGSMASLNNFKRGQPYNRSSKKIKQMFKTVLEKQMNALSKLEKFYETQVIFLEQNRQKDLEQNPDQKEIINQLYDEKLNKLEERVQKNLHYISESKANRQELNKENRAKTLTHTLSQIMLLKQLQNQNGTQNKSRALNDLKSNLINQNNLLPSKMGVRVKRHSDAFENSNQDNETAFKRHLSLPFKQSKNISFDRTSQLSGKIARSPKMTSLAYSSSKVKYNKYLNSANALTSSPLVSEQNNLPKKQYQKNNRKFSTSTENIAQLRRLNDDLSSESINLALGGSKFAQIKRQNRSVSSFKSDFITDDKSFYTANDDSYRFHSTSTGRNLSFFSSVGFDNSNHLIKFAAPRLSDCHIHYKIKMATRNEMLSLTTNQLRNSQNLNDTQIANSNSMLLIETEV